MADLSSQISPEVDMETQTLLDQILAEIQDMNTRIERDDADISRLKAESKIITDHTDKVLSQLCVQLDALRRPA